MNEIDEKNCVPKIVSSMFEEIKKQFCIQHDSNDRKTILSLKIHLNESENNRVNDNLKQRTRD